jgi:hypothetical protein
MVSSRRHCERYIRSSASNFAAGFGAPSGPLAASGFTWSFTTSTKRAR